MTSPDTDFEGFSSDDWVNWLSDALAGLVGVGAGQPTDAETHHVVGEIFERLLSPTARRSFESALEVVLSGVSFTRNACEEIYSTLQLVALVKPPAASRMLERRIYDGSFADLEYASVNLEDLAMTVRSQFDMTTDFCLFLQGCISSGASRKRRFVAARCLSMGGPDPTRSALRLLLQALDGNEAEVQFAVLLRDVWLRFGGGLVFDWYHLVQSDAPKETRQKLDQLLSSRVVPWEDREKLDAYGFLLSAQVNAAKIDVTAADLIQVASLNETVGKERVKTTLHKLWDALTANRGVTEPWHSVDSSGLENVFRDPEPEPLLKHGVGVLKIPGWKRTGLLLEEVGLEPHSRQEVEL